MSGMLITVTNAGRAALVAPGNDGTNAHQIVAIGLATAPFVADKGITELPHEYKRIKTFAGTNVARDTIHVTIRDESSDQFTLYGFGLYLEDGTLVALYGQRTPIMEKSPAAALLIAADLQFASLDAAKLVFGDTSFANPPATTEVPGVVELATIEETHDGTDTSRAVTPVGLHAAMRSALESKADLHHTHENPPATTEAPGVVELATTQETLAGTDTTRAVTPAGLNSALWFALEDKADVGHIHEIEEVPGLRSELDEKFDKAGGTVTGPVTVPELFVGNENGKAWLAATPEGYALGTSDATGRCRSMALVYDRAGDYLDAQRQLRVSRSIGFPNAHPGGADFNYLSHGNGDGASRQANNIQLRSWWGIGFGPSVGDQPVSPREYSHWFDTRTGETGMRGRLTVGGSYVQLDSANGNGQQRSVHHNDDTIGFVGAGGAWTVRFRDDGNFWTPAFGWMDQALNARAPVRSHHAGHGYVLNDSAHGVHIQWQGSYLDAFVDGQWQGWLVTHTNVRQLLRAAHGYGRQWCRLLPDFHALPPGGRWPAVHRSASARGVDVHGHVLVGR